VTREPPKKFPGLFIAYLGMAESRLDVFPLCSQNRDLVDETKFGDTRDMSFTTIVRADLCNITLSSVV
jgi:hypothetical protein